MALTTSNLLYPLLQLGGFLLYYPVEEKFVYIDGKPKQIQPLW